MAILKIVVGNNSAADCPISVNVRAEAVFLRISAIKVKVKYADLYSTSLRCASNALPVPGSRR